MTAVPVLVDVETRGALGAFLATRPEALEQARATVEREVSALTRSLGVPADVVAAAAAEEHAGGSASWLVLHVDGTLCHHSDELGTKAAAYVEGVPAYDVRPVPSALERWIAAESVDDLARLVGVLAVEAVKLRPSVLLGEPQVDAYAGSFGPSAPADVAWLREVLTSLLDLGIALPPAERIAAALANAAGVSAADARELLVPELASDTLELFVADEHRAALTAIGDEGESLLGYMRRSLFEELGIVLPPFSFGSTADLGRETFSVRINDLLLLPQVPIAPTELFVNGTVDEVREAAGVDGRPAHNPATGLAGAIVDTSVRERLESEGYTTWDASGYVVLSIAEAVRQNAGCFVHAGTLEAQLERLELAFPVLVRAAGSRLGLPELAAAARALVADQVPIRDLRVVLERVVDLEYAGRDDPDAVLGDTFDGRFGAVDERPRDEQLVRFLRAGLRRQITEKRAPGGTPVVVYLLDEAIEELVRSDGTQLGEADVERIHDAVRTELAFLPPNVVSPAILAWDDVRARLSELLRATFPRIFVLGYQDIESDVNVQPIARLSLT